MTEEEVIWSKIKHLSSDKQKDALRLIQAERYKSSLYLFAKDCLGFKDVNLRTHGGMITALESDRKRKLLCLPRGCLKSSIGVVAYSIWRLIRNPDERILIDSELFSNSKNFIHEIKAHMMSEKMIRLFGRFDSDDRWSSGEVVIRQRTKKHLKEASITAGGIGTVKVGCHYSLIVADDMNSFKNSATIEGRNKVILHYRGNLSILDPGGEYVILGTRYASNDIIGWIISTEIE